MNKHILIILAAIATFSSCKKSWLEIIPLGQQVAVTVADYDKILNDPAFYNSNSSYSWAEAQLMGDEVAAEGAFFANKGSRDYRDRFFAWRDSIYPLADVTPFSLNSHLNQMLVLNKVIKEVMQATEGTAVRKAELRAEALAARAWSNFNMANYYCKPYVESTAANDPGFPIITVPDVNVEDYPRGNVKSFYEFIISDLLEALKTIPQKQAMVTRWSKPAVEGILGKVYLFMGKPEQAVPYLKSALNNVTLNAQSILYDYNQTLALNGSFYPIDLNSGPVNGPGNLQNDLKEAVVSKVFNSGRYGGNYTGNDGLVLSDFAQDLYEASDWRLLFYTNKNPDNSLNAHNRLRKYGVKFSRFGLQLPDLYLLAAEAKARTSDLAGAVQDLESLRRKRMPVSDAMIPTAIATDQTALIKYILDERVREFAMEGYRWFDMRRMSVDPLFAGKDYKHFIYNEGLPATVFTLEQPNRFVMLLPRNITDGNPDMVNNP